MCVFFITGVPELIIVRRYILALQEQSDEKRDGREES